MIKNRTLREWVDGVVVSAIFVEVLLFAASGVVSRFVSIPAYALFWYPLICSLELFVAALLFLWKATRIGGCAYSLISSILFLILTASSIAAIILQKLKITRYSTIHTYLEYMVIVGVIIVTLRYIYRRIWPKKVPYEIQP